jgi:polysaccharide biosynthesis protein PslH
MRILLITSDLPHPAARHGGGQLTSRWVRELSGSHSYSLLSFVRKEEEPRLSSLREHFAAVRTVPAERGLGNRLARSPLLLSRPFAVAATASRRLKAALGEMLADGGYDCVQLENFHMGQYARSIPESIPRVLVYQDLAGDVLRQQVWLARRWKKYFYFRQWQLSSYWEKWYAIWSKNVFVMSLKDRREVDSWDIGVRTFTMPPLLDPALLALPEGGRDQATILFIGALHRPGNIDAVIRLKEEILPRVRRECPAARCLIVGARPPDRIRRLAAADFVVTGTVERIEPYLSSASLLAVPLRVAGGIILKIVEAMTAACPVVASRSANAGVGARDGRDILLADRTEDFADAVVRLLRSPGERQRLGRAGRNWAREKFQREESRLIMEEAYRRIVAGG